MKITQFLSVAAIATTAFTGTLSAAADMTEFNGKNPAQLRAMAGQYKTRALAAAANPYDGSTTDMLVKADAVSINAYLAHVAPDVKAAFTAFLTVLNTGGSPADVIFDPLVATGVAPAGGGVPANLSNCQMWDGTNVLNTGSYVVNSANITGSGPYSATFNFNNSLTMFDGLDSTLAVVAPLASRDLFPVMAQKALVDAGILAAIDAWLDLLIPGGNAVVPFGATPNTDLAAAGVAADTLGEFKATIAAGTIHSAAH